MLSVGSGRVHITKTDCVLSLLQSVGLVCWTWAPYRAAVVSQIRFFLLQNRQGKTRLSKWYVDITEPEKRKIESEVHRCVHLRAPHRRLFRSEWCHVMHVIHPSPFARVIGVWYAFPCCQPRHNAVQSLHKLRGGASFWQCAHLSLAHAHPFAVAALPAAPLPLPTCSSRTTKLCTGDTLVSFSQCVWMSMCVSCCRGRWWCSRWQVA